MKLMKNDTTLDQLLKEMAADHRPQLPSPGLIWWRAQLYRKQKEKERIERPLIVMQQVAAITSGTVLVALFADNFGQMQTVIRNNSWFLMPAPRDATQRCADYAGPGKCRPFPDCTVEKVKNYAGCTFSKRPQMGLIPVLLGIVRNSA
jgi:hypothetical protein